MIKGLKGIGNIIESAVQYKVTGKYKCDNCGREIKGFSIPKGTTIKQFLKENPCKQCGVGTMKKV